MAGRVRVGVTIELRLGFELKGFRGFGFRVRVLGWRVG